jgi:hypothetical protein
MWPLHELLNSWWTCWKTGGILTTPCKRWLDLTCMHPTKHTNLYLFIQIWSSCSEPNTILSWLDSLDGGNLTQLVACQNQNVRGNQPGAKIIRPVSCRLRVDFGRQSEPSPAVGTNDDPRWRLVKVGPGRGGPAGGPNQPTSYALLLLLTSWLDFARSRQLLRNTRALFYRRGAETLRLRGELEESWRVGGRRRAASCWTISSGWWRCAWWGG